MNMEKVEEEIAAIGKQMVACDHKCAGISCDQSNGMLPRCLTLESTGRSNGTGCVIVGLNPGHANAAEIAYYGKVATYETTVKYWHAHITSQPYYERLRRLMKSFNLDGPILWTELAKCENVAGAKYQPLNALRVCAGKFLANELGAIPKDWPLFGVSRETYKALAYLYPDRTIIGVPHPRRAYGRQFSRLLELDSESKEIVRRALSSHGELLWLGDIGRKIDSAGSVAS